MNNKDIIAKIKAEIDKRYAEYREKMKTDDFTYYEGMADALDLFEQFIDTLESEKPMNLEEEINRYLREECSDDDEPGISDIARHFAEWGYLRAAEKYNEIEYNRQRTEEQPVGLVTIKPTLPAAPKPCIATFKEQDSSSEISNDLEEAAEKYQACVPVDTTIYYCGANEDVYFANRIVDAFKAGAKWQEEQDKETIELAEEHAYLAGAVNEREKMMKEAIHYVVQDDLDSHGASYNIPFIRIGTTALKPKGIGVGDKVRIIIVKEDEK